MNEAEGTSNKDEVPRPKEEEGAVSLLTTGLLENMREPLHPLSEKLLELERNQDNLMRFLQHEAGSLSALPEWPAIAHVLKEVPSYTAKLEQMRADMHKTSERVKRLNARAQRLKQRKQQEEEKERQLMAKPSASLLQAATGQEVQQQMESS
ncbi:biogenesis of lysosome-related organelles complex 1 subunit 6 [Balamuthia mandrillaris]